MLKPRTDVVAPGRPGSTPLDRCGGVSDKEWQEHTRRKRGLLCARNRLSLLGRCVKGKHDHFSCSDLYHLLSPTRCEHLKWYQ